MNNASKKDLPIDERMLALTILSLLFAVFVWAVYNFLPVHVDAQPELNRWGFGVDWKGCIRPDTLRLISGSPYDGCGLNPPWTYLLLLPVALFSPALGAAIMFVLSAFCYGFVLYRMGAKPLALLAFVLSPLALTNGMNGNIDWMVALGFVLPPQIGLFFVLIKPHLGIGAALFWLAEAWRRGKLREVTRVSGPVILAFLLSFALYGLWPLRYAARPADPYNASLWPLSLPFGVAMLLHGVRHRRFNLAAASSLLITPYAMAHSFVFLLFALPIGSLEYFTASVGLWAIPLAGLFQ